MEVLGGQPWKASARASMHWTTASRLMRAFSDLRTSGSDSSTPLLKTVEGIQLVDLEG